MKTKSNIAKELAALAEVWLDGMDIGEAMLATGLAKRWEER